MSPAIIMIIFPWHHWISQRPSPICVAIWASGGARGKKYVFRLFEIVYFLVFIRQRAGFCPPLEKSLRTPMCGKIEINYNQTRAWFGCTVVHIRSYCKKGTGFFNITCKISLVLLWHQQIKWFGKFSTLCLYLISFPDWPPPPLIDLRRLGPWQQQNCNIFFFL